MRLRDATEQDIPTLSAHHRMMFEEIWHGKNDTIGPAAAIELEQSYTSKLKLEMPEGSCKAWVFENDRRVIASGAISMVGFVPTPNDFSSKVAYLHSVYTEREYRNNALANRIVQKALEYCRSAGIKRVMLNASEAGRSIYEKIGFAPAPDFMRIFL